MQDATVLWVCLHNPDGGMYQRHLSRTLQHRQVVHRLGSPVCIAMIFGVRFLGHSSFRTRAGTGSVWTYRRHPYFTSTAITASEHHPFCHVSFRTIFQPERWEILASSFTLPLCRACL